MTYEDKLWNLAFSNVGRLHGEPRNQRDVSHAIQAISGIRPPTYQQRQRATGGVRVTKLAAHAHTSQSHKSVGSPASSSKPSQQNLGTSPSYQFVYWQPNVKSAGGTAANNVPTPSPYNYPASHGIPGRQPHSLYGAAQPWRLGR